MNLNSLMYACSSASTSLGEIKSKAFEKSVKSAQKYFPLSTANIHFPFFVLHPFRKQHCRFEKKCSMKIEIFLKTNRSNTFNTFGNMLTDLSFHSNFCFLS